ncbi:hypothetical protein H311_02743 [Anncaliia algerae PRA109]|nr:hypothetical protein H311_02743 [Anncaliia algerae PRA109]
MNILLLIKENNLSCVLFIEPLLNFKFSLKPDSYYKFL